MQELWRYRVGGRTFEGGVLAGHYDTKCAETHLGGGVMSPFVSLWFAIARVHDSTVISIVALRKGSVHIVSYTDAYMLKLTLVARL